MNCFTIISLKQLKISETHWFVGEPCKILVGESCTFPMPFDVNNADTHPFLKMDSAELVHFAFETSVF